MSPPPTISPASPTFARSTSVLAWSFSFRCSIFTLLNLQGHGGGSGVKVSNTPVAAPRLRIQHPGMQPPPHHKHSLCPSILAPDSSGGGALHPPHPQFLQR